MAKQKTKGWDTSFETATNTMTHTFTDRVQVVSNIKNGEILVKVDGNIVDVMYNLPICQYEKLLLAVEANAYKRQRRDGIKMQVCKAIVYTLIAIGVVALISIGGDCDEWTMGQFLGQKAACFAIMGVCWFSVKHTPALAAAWEEIDKSIEEC